MPYKFNESLGHKIKKARYKVTNWAHYNDALRRRGDISIWFTQDAIDQWRPAKTEGLMTSIARVMDVAISIPDFSCIASTRCKSCHPTPRDGSSVFDR